MTWTAYKVVLRLLTPLHVGAGSLGNVQRARPYVTGKSIWGALTARLTRDNPDLGGDYGAVGRRANEELAFSYFYPATGEQVDLWPWEDPDQFAWRYLGSYASTALDYGSNAAEEDSLHETEYIAPTTRDGKPVYLVGYIFADAGCTLPWKQALARLQLGGERTYGWGRVALQPVALAADLFGCYPLTLDSPRPVLKPGEDTAVMAHTLASGEKAVTARGSLVPLVGRETRSAADHGRYLSRAIICYEPGSVVDEKTQVAVGPHGIWEAAP